LFESEAGTEITIAGMKNPSVSAMIYDHDSTISATHYTLSLVPRPTQLLLLECSMEKQGVGLRTRLIHTNVQDKQVRLIPNKYLHCALRDASTSNVSTI